MAESILSQSAITGLVVSSSNVRFHEEHCVSAVPMNFSGLLGLPGDAVSVGESAAGTIGPRAAAEPELIELQTLLITDPVVVAAASVVLSACV